jgi:sugar lactone lactonase YvrE
MRQPRLLLSMVVAVGLFAETPASAELVPEDAAVEIVADGFRFTEGPALGTDHAIYFSDIPNRKVHRFDPHTGETTVFLEDSGGSNGLAFDPRGRLVLAVDRDRYIGRLDQPGRILVVEDRFEGRRFNSPNDLTIDAHGGVYFTDPRYGRQDGRELEVEAVYYLGAGGNVTLVRQLITDLKKPNGIVLSPDGKTLYVADNGDPALMAYRVVGPGQLADPTVFARPPQATPGGPDGLAVDRHGNVYAAWHGANAIFIWNPDGQTLGTIDVPGDQPTNVAFAADGQTLYITGGRLLRRIRLNVPD